MKKSEKFTLFLVLLATIIGNVFLSSYFKMSITESLTLIAISTSAIIGVINLLISSGLDRRLKAYDLWIEEVHVLNVKMHDRLVDVEDSINQRIRPSDEVRKRLLYNASRFYKHNDSIIDDVNLLINKWTVMFDRIENQSINDDEISKSKDEIVNSIKVILKKVDAVQKEQNK